MTNKINLWMPISKSIDGDFIGILSDDSIDRDGEFMTKELLNSWVKRNAALPMLANHENKLEKLIGGWSELNVISKGENSALTAKPFFLESNPLGKQAKEMVKEALAKGLNIGISIGAIPQGKMVDKQINGKTFKGYTEAEILEATIVPIQSNRNASFTALAKSFDINMEDDKMSENISKDVPEQQEVAEAVEEAVETKEEVVEAPVEEKEEEEVKEEVAEEKDEEEKPELDPQAEVDALKAKNAELEKELAELKTKSINLPTIDGPVNKNVDMDNEPLTVEKMLKLRYGGQ